ncbi:MAG TPA: hypothetical protein VF961_00050 [Pyrinomonadaceae bacterium]
MPSTKTKALLDRLDDAKRSFSSGTQKDTEKILARIARHKIGDAESIVRFHELLLFVCAYPQSARVKQVTESLLKSFHKRVESLRDAEVDLDSLERPEVSGIAGTSVTDTFGFFIVQWLSRLHPTQLALDWDWFEDENRLAQTWPRFMPLLEDDAAVEANVPYQAWLRAARPAGMKDLRWLLQQFESAPKTEKEKAEIYDSQQVYVRWTPLYRATRTGMRLPVRKVFFHREPLIRRRDVSLRTELEKPSPTLQLLTPKQGEAILDMAREASTVRYRELYGFTHSDAKRVFKTNIGRGVDIFVMGLPAEWRLPLRAYHAAMIFKNGVPIGYFEGLSLFERMESGFNLYYSFRDGETAWLYARTLNIFRHLLGVTAFSLDPYQIGHENEEGIESGAFWFYRKLGFRPTKPDIRKLVAREEEKLEARPAYRTSARTLRKLAAGSMIFEMDQSRVGDWDQFQVRKIGLAVQLQMAAKFSGEAERLRNESVKTVVRTLKTDPARWDSDELTALRDFAVVLSLVPDLGRWSTVEKQQLVQIVQAKAGRDEARYLKLMQKHIRLRKEITRLGS